MNAKYTGQNFGRSMQHTLHLQSGLCELSESSGPSQTSKRGSPSVWRRELGQENRLAFRDGLAETDPLIVVLNWFGGSLCAPDRFVEVSGRLLRPRSKSRNHRALDLSHRPATRRSILSVAAHP